MDCTTVSPASKGRKVILIAVGIAFLSSQVVAQSSLAKRPSFLVPSYDKLVDGAGPETNDISRRQAEEQARSGDNLLAPVTLGGDKAGQTTGFAQTNGAGGPLLKSTVTATSFVPKGPVDPASKSLFVAPHGISEKLGENLKKAKSVNVMPLPLLMSEDEADRKIETIVDAEKAELAELWESTLSRSPDIQFVVQKLMPTSNPGHTSTIIMRMLSSAMFGAMGAMNMMAPSAGMYAANTAGYSMIMNVLQAQENKQAKNARLTQTEAIMLYTMVRRTADQLVENFRNYKKTVSTLTKANIDLVDLQGMVAEARSGQDAAKQVEMDYTLRKAQRDVDSIAEDARRFRQSLVDQAGNDAVAKLDKEIGDEQSRIWQATPAGTPDNQQGTSEPNHQTAANSAARG